MQLEFDHLSKSYGRKEALCDLSVTLSHGVCGLLGPNGAGKSTLMNIAVGNLVPTGGEVRRNGVPIDQLGAQYRASLGFLPQQLGLYPAFTARRYLRYMAALKGVFSARGERAARERHIDELLEQVNLTADADRKIGGFSGGMKQRLGIAQMLLGEPRLLILDEPTAGLDPQERMRLRSLIAALSADRVVLWATHIVSDIESIAGRVLLLKSGQLVADGAPDDLLSHMQGQVWEVVLPEAEAMTLRERYAVSNLLPRDDGVALRIVHPACPHERAVTVTPRLEDLYLFHFREAGT